MQEDEQAEVDTREEQVAEYPGSTTEHEGRGKPSDEVKEDRATSARDGPKPATKEDLGSEDNDKKTSDPPIEAEDVSICSGISQHANPNATPSSPAKHKPSVSMKSSIRGDEDDEPLVSYLAHQLI